MEFFGLAQIVAVDLPGHGVVGGDGGLGDVGVVVYEPTVGYLAAAET